MTAPEGDPAGRPDYRAELRFDPDAAFKMAFREAMAELAYPPAITPVSAEELEAERRAEPEAEL